MKKILYLYWYVPNPYWRPLYALHLRNLMAYRGIFDETNIIISKDKDTQGVEETIETLRYVLPNANITFFDNDKESRESAFFYEHIVEKLSDFDNDTAIFFAHNKGVDTTYVTPYDRDAWINSMYYFNLSDKNKIDELLSDKTTCAIGTGKMDNYCPPAFTSFCKYRWMFSGTFFWLVPRRIDAYIKSHYVTVVPNTGRYYTEGFLGMIFPANAKEIKCIGTTKVVPEQWDDYLVRNLTNETLDSFIKVHGSIISDRNLDIFIFAHKQFENKRFNPTYKIVCSSDCDIHSDKLGIIKFDCELSNVGFSEWQKIYEIYTKRSNLLKDYVGLAHFHRYLAFSEDVNFIPYPYFPKIFEHFDILTKAPVKAENGLREQYAFCHNIKDFDLMMDVIREDFPDWYRAAIECEKNGLIFDSNIMILKRDDFMKMCDFVFPVLFKYCERVGIDRTSDESFIEHVNNNEGYDKIHKPNDKFNEQARICSYLAERLVVMFITRYTPRINILKMVEE